MAHRTDLNYVLSEMISELTVQHTYIDGGDMQLPPRPHAGLPGARFEVDAASGRYRIAKIFQGQNEEEIYRSPLTEVGVDARVGDYVLAINGEDVTAKQDIYKFLRNAGDAPVQLTLNTTPALAGARTVTYRPLASETNLVYFNWVEQNRRKVDELSHGRIGYMHLPDMGAEGISEFIKWYYPQLRKEALLIDDRANGGGNVSRMIVTAPDPHFNGARLPPQPRHCRNLSRERLHRPQGRAARWQFRLRRRHLPVDVPHR